MDSNDLKLVASVDHACNAASHLFLQEHHSDMFKNHCHTGFVKHGGHQLNQHDGHQQARHEPEPYLNLHFNEEEEKAVIAPYFGFSVGHEAEKTIFGGHEDTHEVVEKATEGLKIKPGTMLEEEALPIEFGAGFHLKY